jgi:uncharacterized membrane protein
MRVGRVARKALRGRFCMVVVYSSRGHALVPTPLPLDAPAPAHYCCRMTDPEVPAVDSVATDERRSPVVLRALAPVDPLRWLALGWRDFRHCPALGLFYGACFASMGWTIVKVYDTAPAYVMALCAGFLLAGPFLCLGLYRASQRLERGERPGFADSLFAWQTRTGTLAIFGFVLLILELLWGRATLVIFALTFDGLPDLRSSLAALLDPANLGFTLAWLGLGAIFAGLIFAVSVVSMPMILDRQVDAITAGLTSMRLVLANTRVMLAWGALIAVIVAIAMVPGFLGLLVAGPVLGHASWHAYRGAVMRASPPG